MQRHLDTALPLLLGLLASGSLRVEESFRLHDEISRVKVRWAAGDLHISARSQGSVSIATTAWGPESPLAFHHELDGELLTLELRCRTPVPCGGDLDLGLPPGVRVEADLGEGKAVLEGPLGDVSVLVGAGSLHASGLASTDAVLQVVQGEVLASWSVAPQRVVAATVSGDIDLQLPPERYRLSELAPSCEVRGIELDASSQRKLEVTSVEGQVRIQGLRAVVEGGDVQPCEVGGVATL